MLPEGKLEENPNNEVVVIFANQKMSHITRRMRAVFPTMSGIDQAYISLPQTKKV